MQKRRTAKQYCTLCATLVCLVLPLGCSLSHEDDAPECWEGDEGVVEGAVELRTQTEVNELERVGEVTGELSIGPMRGVVGGELAGLQGPEDEQVEADPIESLHPLRCLVTVGGDFSIRRTELTSLDGLQNLESVRGNTGTEIDSNPALTDLAALASTSTLSLYITWNNALADLAGLESFTSFDGHLIIRGNRDLTDLAGLNNVSRVGGNLGIQFNALTTLGALDTIAKVGGDLFVIGEHWLVELDGLDGLTSIDGDLSIQHNGRLTDLTGLDRLTTITGDLHIDHNDELSECIAVKLANRTGKTCVAHDDDTTCSDVCTCTGNLDISTCQ